MFKFICILLGHNWKQVKAKDNYHNFAFKCKRCGKVVELRKGHPSISNYL